MATVSDNATPGAGTPDSFDLIIVGSGSGNSIPEYLDDRKIAIVERGVFGGTCLNRGCIPSKMFVLPADLALEAADSSRLGLHTSFNGVNWPVIRDRVFGRIDPISAGGREYRATGTPNITLIEGTARFVEEKVLDVDGRLITAPQILVAAGARPHVPDIPGLRDVEFHTSDTVMRLDELPERLGIIGGGFIAAEMGHVFSAYGSRVTLVARSATMLRGFDGEVARRFTHEFGRHVDLRLGEVPRSVEQTPEGIVIDAPSGRIVVDQLLVATGRTPNTDLLDPQAAGIGVTDAGTIGVDETMATNVDGVWAIGDIANTFQLKHLANAEAKVAFWNIAHPDDRREQRYDTVPSAVFSHPQIATVGLTEEVARERGIDIAVGRRDYAGTAYGWALVDETSFAKVLVDRATGLIVGAHIMGPQAGSLIQPIIQAMTFGQTAAEVAREVFYIHPALTEVVENALLDALE